MSTARDYLAAVQQRADAATSGPWRASEHVDIYEPGYEVYRVPADGGEFGTDGWVAWANRADAAFIAASRTDVPRLVAALTAVLDLADMGDDRCDYGTVTGDDIDYSGPVVLTRELREAIINVLTPKEDEQ